MDVKNYMLSLTPSPEPNSKKCKIKNIGKRPRRTRLHLLWTVMLHCKWFHSLKLNWQRLKEVCPSTRLSCLLCPAQGHAAALPAPVFPCVHMERVGCVLFFIYVHYINYCRCNYLFFVWQTKMLVWSVNPLPPLKTKKKKILLSLSR